MKTAVVMAVLLALSHPPAHAQSAAEIESLKKDIDALKEGQTAIQKDLQEIKALLRARPSAAAPAQEVVLTVGDAPSKGNKDARLTLVEFTDYQ
jgi:protein-disulfide isomerase